ncbi:MAG: AtpZ/AtpI family protein [Deltaproteobacteria bacterium]|jgi:F0F1-type ATP synthase assembly protein I|nr:AtpZ/AtpI family protein [Deltaproteobacteria bacterium]
MERKLSMAARYGSLGVELVSPPVAGALLGHYLDLYFGTEPWLTLVMLVTGVIAAIYRMVQVLNAMSRER